MNKQTPESEASKMSEVAMHPSVSGNKFYGLAIAAIVILIAGGTALYKSSTYDVSPAQWSENKQFTLPVGGRLTLDYSSDYSPNGGIFVRVLPRPEISGAADVRPSSGRAYVSPRGWWLYPDLIDDRFEISVSEGKTIAIVTDGRGGFFSKLQAADTRYQP